MIWLSLPQNKPLLDNCSAAYNATDWALWVTALLGDGIAIGGILTANPGAQVGAIDEIMGEGTEMAMGG